MGKSRIYRILNKRLVQGDSNLIDDDHEIKVVQDINNNTVDLVNSEGESYVSNNEEVSAIPPLGYCYLAYIVPYVGSTSNDYEANPWEFNVENKKLALKSYGYVYNDEINELLYVYAGMYIDPVASYALPSHYYDAVEYGNGYFALVPGKAKKGNYPFVTETSGSEPIGNTEIDNMVNGTITGAVKVENKTVMSDGPQTLLVVSKKKGAGGLLKFKVSDGKGGFRDIELSIVRGM